MFSGPLRYLSSFLVLEVPELDAAADWYRAAFGFEVIAGGADAGRSWMHMRRSEGQDIVLTRAETAVGGAEHGVVVHLATEQNVQGLADQARHVGGELMEPIGPDADRAGLATVRDPYGYKWTFFRRSVPNLEEPGASVVSRREAGEKP